MGKMENLRHNFNLSENNECKNDIKYDNNKSYNFN